MQERQYRNRFLASLVGLVVVALCCFTPVLALAVAALGLGALTGYLDFVLWPALLILVWATIQSYRNWRRACKAPGSRLRS